MLLLGLNLSGCWHDSTPAPVENGWLASSQQVKVTSKRKLRQEHNAYRVAAGDTLYSIAWKNNLDYRQLARLNHIPAPYAIYRGQILKIKPGYVANVHRQIIKHKKQHKVKHVTKKFLAKRKIIYHNEPIHDQHWRWPTRGSIISYYSSANKGVDIAGRLNQAIIATASGIVVYAGSGLSSYGNLLIIKHNSKYLTAYAHNSKLLVKEGQKVKTGQKIALMGKTGSNHVMLHFEIRRNGKPVNPLQYFAKR